MTLRCSMHRIRTPLWSISATFLELAATSSLLAHSLALCIDKAKQNNPKLILLAHTTCMLTLPAFSAMPQSFSLFHSLYSISVLLPLYLLYQFLHTVLLYTLR